jgi:hypothetical protein
MFADTNRELMAMAKILGLKPAWIQHEGQPTEHFDLTPNKRSRAMIFGAVEIDREGYLELMDRKVADAKV